MKYRCRAQKPDGKLCRNLVKNPDVRCRHHQGKPEGRVSSPKWGKRKAAKKPAKKAVKKTVKKATRRSASKQRSGPVGVRKAFHRSPPASPAVARTLARPARPIVGPRFGRAGTGSSPERRRLDEAAALCVDILSDGGTAAVAERVTTYVSDETWRRLKKYHGPSGCEELAELAGEILAGKEKLHSLVGRAVDWVLAALGRGGIERIFARELATRIPLPMDSQLSAAARGLQAAGIVLCLGVGRTLADCACLRMIVKEEGEDRLQQLMENSLEDWQCISHALPGPVVPG